MSTIFWKCNKIFYFSRRWKLVKKFYNNSNAGTQNTLIYGSVGASGTITCNSPCQILGERHSNDIDFNNTLNDAKNTKAFIDSLTCNFTFPSSNIASNTILTCGVWCASSSNNINFQGNLILNGQNNQDCLIFIITQTSKTITFSNNMNVLLVNKTQAW